MAHKIKVIKATVKPWHGLKRPVMPHIPMPKDAWKVELKRTIELPASQFARYQRISDEIAALERQRKAIKEAWTNNGLLPVTNEANAGEYVIVKANGDEQGKATIFYHSGATIPAGYRLKIS